MSIDDYYCNAFQAERKRRARKEHACCACNETIRRGDLYVYTTIKDENGDIDACKHCLRCNAICRALWANGAGMIDMTLDCGHTWEEADHSDGRPPPPEVAALAFLTPDEMQKLHG